MKNYDASSDFEVELFEYRSGFDPASNKLNQAIQLVNVENSLD